MGNMYKILEDRFFEFKFNFLFVSESGNTAFLDDGKDVLLVTPVTWTTDKEEFNSSCKMLLVKKTKEDLSFFYNH